jgi:hypothetical protein
MDSLSAEMPASTTGETRAELGDMRQTWQPNLTQPDAPLESSGKGSTRARIISDTSLASVSKDEVIDEWNVLGQDPWASALLAIDHPTVENTVVVDSTRRVESDVLDIPTQSDRTVIRPETKRTNPYLSETPTRDSKSSKRVNPYLQSSRKNTE